MRVLFVDDDPKLLGSIRRMALSHEELAASFAASGEEALKLMERDRFDILVADMRMPGMDGATLLEHVQELHPDTIRIVLSGHSDEDLVRKAAGLAHQFLSKPCSFDHILDVLSRLHNLRSILTNERIRSVVGQVGMLPVLPKIYTELTTELESDSGSLPKVGAIVARDVGLTAGILKIVNSSFFGLAKPITTPDQAVTYLGLDLIRGLVLAQKLFKTFDTSRHPNLSVQLLWGHSLNTAFCCKMICETSALGADKDEGFNAGLLHDVGKLIMVDRFAEKYGEVLSDLNQSAHPPLVEIEAAKIGVTHAELGAYLLGLWGFPQDMVKAVFMHHAPTAGKHSPSPLTAALHIANVLEHELVIINENYTRPSLDRELLSRFNITDKDLDQWREKCAEALQACDE